MAVRTRLQARALAGNTHDEGRPPEDFYETPPEAVWGLLLVERFTGPIWEPACGKGAISRVLEERGHEVISTDLVDRGYGRGGVEFLNAPVAVTPDGRRVVNLVTNPPFCISLEFARRGCQVIHETGGKLALLQKVQWEANVTRAAMFRESRLARVWVLSRRIPMMHRPDHQGPRASQMVDYAWFVWEAGHEGSCSLGWVDWQDATRRPAQLALEVTP